MLQRRKCREALTVAYPHFAAFLQLSLYGQFLTGYDPIKKFKDQI